MSTIESTSGLSGAALFQVGREQDARRAEFEAKFTQAALAAGLDPSAAGALQDEIRTAIAAALKNADGITDRRQITQSAIDGVLESHGVDLEKFRAQMQPPAGGPGGAGGPSGPGGPGGAGGPPPQGPPPNQAQEGDLEETVTQAALAAGLDSESADELQDELESMLDEILANASRMSNPKRAIQDAIQSLLQSHGVDVNEFQSQFQRLTGGTQGTLSLVDEQA